MKKHIISWSKTLLLFMAIIWAVNAWRTREVPAQAPNFTAHTLFGQAISLTAVQAKHPGKPLALLFWAEWCAVCRTEQHSIDRMQRDPDINLLLIATQSGSANEIQAELKARGLDWSMLVDEDGSLLSQYGLYGVPSFVILGKNGQIVSTQMGYTSELGMRWRLWWAGRFD